MTMYHSFVVVVDMTKCQGLNTVKTKEIIYLLLLLFLEIEKHKIG